MVAPAWPDPDVYSIIGKPNVEHWVMNHSGLVQSALSAPEVYSIDRNPIVDRWIVDSKGCQVANRNPKPGETITWTGPCESGYADGQGVLSWFRDGKSTATYTGSMKAGRPDGRGSYQFANGDRYEGEFVSGEAAGKGTLHLTSGEQIETGFLHHPIHSTGHIEVHSALINVCHPAGTGPAQVTLVDSSGVAKDDVAAIRQTKIYESQLVLGFHYYDSECYMLGLIFSRHGWGYLRSRP